MNDELQVHNAPVYYPDTHVNKAVRMHIVMIFGTLFTQHAHASWRCGIRRSADLNTDELIHQMCRQLECYIKCEDVASELHLIHHSFVPLLPFYYLFVRLTLKSYIHFNLSPVPPSSCPYCVFSIDLRPWMYQEAAWRSEVA